MTYGYAEDDCDDEYPDRPPRSKKRLNKMHLYAHRRFHEAKPGTHWLWWLEVRTKIQKLIIKEVRSEATGTQRDEA